MRRTIWIAASLLMLSACGGGASDPVGENSAGSIRTTAVGEVVANAATPTPTPAATQDMASNATDAVSDDSADIAGNAM
jgi:hypothetical protein